jgi:hypothetical protein
MIDGSRQSARLVVEYGPWSGKNFLLDKPTQIIGRAPECDIVLEDREVSRQHSRFFWRNDQLFVEDLGSANGTLINGVPIATPQLLYATDKIEIGASTLAVQGLPAGIPAAVAAPMSAPAASYSPPQQRSNRTLWVLIGGLVLAVLLFLVAVAAYLYFGQVAPAEVAGAPAVTIVSPPNGAEVPVNVPVSVQATASDQQGVIRIELWADGTLVSQQASQVAGGEPLLLLNIPWTPTIPGNHVLEVRAFNAANQQNQTTLVTLNAVAPPADEPPPGVTVIVQATETPPPTATPVPPPSPQGNDSLPTATPTAVPATAAPSATPQPSLRALAGVNVREGPGTVYQTKGVLAEGQVVQSLGRSPDGGWWQIIFPPGSGSLGWVSGSYVQPNDQAQNLPVVAPPPLPATATFTPPPATPTSSPTPSVTATNSPPPADISFTVDDSSLSPGQCTTLRWRVKNVKAYWVDGLAGVGDEGAKQICDPVGVTTHVLRVQKLDDSVQEYTLTVSVGTDGSVIVPQLIAPENNKEFDYYPREVTFVWAAVSAAGSVWYNIEIEWNGGSSWQTYTLAQSLPNTTFTMDNFVGANPGRWRVWATSSTLGDGPKSEWRYFRFLR